MDSILKNEVGNISPFAGNDFVCSGCGIHLTDWMWFCDGKLVDYYNFNYCPNCGAKVKAMKYEEAVLNGR